MRSNAGTTQVIADTFADWASVHWPADADGPAPLDARRRSGLAQLLTPLPLVRVGLCPTEPDATFVCDYTLGADLTDYLIAVAFVPAAAKLRRTGRWLVRSDELGNSGRMAAVEVNALFRAR